MVTKNKSGIVNKCCKEKAVDEIINRNMLWALAAGLVPVPFVDVGVIMAVQYKMVSEIAKVHGAHVSEKIIKTSVAALVAGVGAIWLTGFSFFSIIPVFGTALHSVAQPIFAAAFTYAIGKTFDSNFVDGKNLLDFSVDKKTKKSFNSHFNDGKKLAKQLKKKIVKKRSTRKAA